MNELELPNYNLEKTLLGGQAFNWDIINGSFYGFTADKIIKITPKGEDSILWQTFPDKDNIEYVSNLLNLSIDYNSILNNINKDDHIAKAIIGVENVRVLRQDFDQTLLSFILTSHKNIKAVRKSIRDLSKSFGQKIQVNGIEFHTFPKAETLAMQSADILKKYGLGFRAIYLLEASKALVSNEVKGLMQDEESARLELLKLKGVGHKIADCVLTFSLGYYTVTPIDIWAARVLSEFYGLSAKSSYKFMRQWCTDYFKDYTAWAGQFLFEYMRENYKKLPRN